MRTSHISLFIILLTLATIAPANGAKEAKARQHLDRFSQLVAHSDGVSLGFTLTMSKDKSIIQKSSGNLRMSGSQYYMQSSGMQIWFDGKTQWSYIESANEVNISTPTNQEVQMINPLILSRSYDKDFNYRTLPIKSVNQMACIAVELTPITKSEFTGVVLYMDPNSCEPLLLELYTNNKEVKTQILIREFKSHLSLTKESFIFPTSKYPKVEIIDLR